MPVWGPPKRITETEVVGMKIDDRIKFIKPNNVEEFINHCGRASVLLDPFIFGSATSFIESMFYGTPTISMPNESMKSRIPVLLSRYQYYATKL